MPRHSVEGPTAAEKIKRLLGEDSHDVVFQGLNCKLKLDSGLVILFYDNGVKLGQEIGWAELIRFTVSGSVVQLTRGETEYELHDCFYATAQELVDELNEQAVQYAEERIINSTMRPALKPRDGLAFSSIVLLPAEDAFCIYLPVAAFVSPAFKLADVVTNGSIDPDKFIQLLGPTDG